MANTVIFVIVVAYLVFGIIQIIIKIKFIMSTSSHTSLVLIVL